VRDYRLPAQGRQGVRLLGSTVIGGPAFVLSQIKRSDSPAAWNNNAIRLTGDPLKPHAYRQASIADTEGTMA